MSSQSASRHNVPSLGYSIRPALSSNSAAALLDAVLTSDQSTSGIMAQSKHLFIAIDYGTKTLAVASRIAKPGETAELAQVCDITFHGKEDYAPQKVAWDDDGKFLWGWELDDAIKKGFSREKVIELWKLLLYKDHRTSAIAERVKEQLLLYGKSIDQLLEEHMRALLQATMDHIKRQVQTPKNIDSMPTKVFMSVPQMWKLPADLQMATAAKKAGIAYVELVFEPQAAAGYYLYFLKNNMDQLTPGDVLLMADIGGGTGDFNSYEFTTGKVAGAEARLKLVGDPKGWFSDPRHTAHLADCTR